MKKSLFIIVALLVLFSRKDNSKATSDSIVQTETTTRLPNDVISFMNEWKILLGGDGTRSEDLVNFEKEDFFYVETENDADWVVYKTPNSGIRSRTSSNTRTGMAKKSIGCPKCGLKPQA